MTSSTLLSTFAVATALVAFGCVNNENVSSDDVATHGMSMNFQVTNDGSHSVVDLEVHVGDWQSHTFAQLSASDELMLTAPVAQKLGVAGTRYNGTYYGASLDSSDGPFVLDFKRTKGVSALGNRLVMPPSFAVTGTTGTTVSRKEALTFNWNRADGGHTMTLDLHGDCVQYTSKSIVGDPGTFVVNAGELKPVTGHDTDSCAVSAVITRTLVNGGSFSAEFGQESRGIGIQTRTVAFTSAP